MGNILASFTGFYAQPWSSCLGGMYRLHNVCVDEFGEKQMQSISHDTVQGFEVEMDHRQNDVHSSFLQMGFHP